MDAPKDTMDNSDKPHLSIIMSTHASLGSLAKVGLAGRTEKLFAKYSEYYDVEIWSPSVGKYRSLGVNKIHTPRRILNVPGLRQLMYFIWLCLEAKNMNGVIKVYGANIPTLGIVKYISQCPIIVTYQWDYLVGTRLNEANPIRRLLAPIMEKLAISGSDTIQTTTIRLATTLSERYGRITTIVPNWVDLDIAKETQEWANRIPNSIIYAGRLHKIKGIDVLLRSVEIAKENVGDISLTIIGSGPEEKSLLRELEERASGHVDYLGVLSHRKVLEILPQFQIFVLPTLTAEGHPKALIEALAAGAVCIATDIPGNQDIIVNGENGILVPPGDVESLANAIQLLLGDREMSKRISMNGAVYAKRFSFARIVQKEIELIDEVLSESRADD